MTAYVGPMHGVQPRAKSAPMNGAAPRPTAGMEWIRHSRCSHGTRPAKTRPSTISTTPMTTVIWSR